MQRSKTLQVYFSGKNFEPLKMRKRCQAEEVLHNPNGQQEKMELPLISSGTCLLYCTGHSQPESKKNPQIIEAFFPN